MDFGQLLHTAQKNEKNGKNEVRYYSTKFEPPKKQKKESRELSANIKKFLARKEAEEKRKADEEKKKREELLALRSQDRKATRRVNVMLKRTKSANQSVIEDAVDNDNTAVTLAGPMQPDEDDYGYVSQEASAFYNKMMEKYSKMPDEPKFKTEKKKVSTNLSSTKDRVKAALEKEKEEAMQPHRRKRKHKEQKDDPEDDGISWERPETKDDEFLAPPPPPPKPKPKPAPPPMNFAELLKIAEKKQFEPIVIEKKEKEEEKPLTKKQKKEMEKERDYLQRKEARRDYERSPLSSADRGPSAKIPKLSEKISKSPTNERSDRIPKVNSQKPLKSSNEEDRIPKLNSGSKPAINKLNSTTKDLYRNKANSSTDTSRASTSHSIKNNAVTSKSSKPPTPSSYTNSKSSENMARHGSSLSNSKDSKLQSQITTYNGKPRDSPADDLKPERKYLPGDIRYKKPTTEIVQNKKLPTTEIKPKKFPADDVKPKQFPEKDLKPKQFPPKDIKPKQFPPKDLKPKQFSPSDVRRKEFPPSDVRRKEFPPSDVRRKEFPSPDVRRKEFPPSDVRRKEFAPSDVRRKEFPPSDVRRKEFPPSDVRRKEFPTSDVRRKEFSPRDLKKKSVIGSKRRILDDDDSEYDSEMDDFIDDDEPEDDYSKYISEIFGYDKSKYRDVDDDVDNMESSFAQQMREEVISAKIGIMEDLEDMKKEEEEKRRKAQLKKKHKL